VSPSVEGRSGYRNRVCPDEENDCGSLALSQGFSGNTVDDYVVTVQGDEDVRPEGTHTGDGTKDSEKCAAKVRESPVASNETVIGKYGEVQHQHKEIQGGQVQHQEIRRSPKFLAFEIQIDNSTVSCERSDAHEDIDNPQDIVPHGVDWGVVCPVGVNQMLDLVGDRVHDGGSRGVAKGCHGFRSSDASENLE